MIIKCGFLEKGLEEQIVDEAKFYDKGYAFFRTCMDSGVDEDDIVDFVKFMIVNDITDSREMTKEMWKEYARGQQHPWTREELITLLENSSEMINIPDLMEFLRPLSEIVLTGGGINECLKEVEIALKSLNKNYKVLSEFTY